MSKTQELFERRKRRVRTKLRSVSTDRPRLSVFRSNKQIHAQIICDKERKTLVSVSTLEKDLRATLKTGSNKDAAEKAGQLIAERAVAQGILEVVFDRGGYIYHGRVKALADAARNGGLKF